MFMVREAPRHHGESTQTLSPPSERVGVGAVRVEVSRKILGPSGRGFIGALRRFWGRRPPVSGEVIIPESAEDYVRSLREDLPVDTIIPSLPERPRRPMLKVSRSVPGISSYIDGAEHLEPSGDKVFGGRALQYLNEREEFLAGPYSQYDTATLDWHNYRIGEALHDVKTKFGALDPESKRYIDLRMDQEDLREVSPLVKASFSRKKLGWADWISTASNGELIDLIRWHDNMLRSPVMPEREKRLQELLSKYESGLEAAVAANKIDEAALAKFRNLKRLNVVITSPFDELSFTREGYFYAERNTLVVAGAHEPGTSDQEIFFHELTHALGHLLHDDTAESALTEAATEYIARIVGEGEDKLESGVYLALRRCLKKVGEYHHHRDKRPANKIRQEFDRNLSRFLVEQDLDAFREHVRSATGFDMLHYITVAYQHRVRAGEDANTAAEQTEVIFGAALMYAMTGRYYYEPDRTTNPSRAYDISPNLGRWLMDTIDAEQKLRMVRTYARAA